MKFFCLNLVYCTCIFSGHFEPLMSKNPRCDEPNRPAGGITAEFSVSVLCQCRFIELRLKPL